MSCHESRLAQLIQSLDPVPLSVSSALNSFDALALDHCLCLYPLSRVHTDHDRTSQGARLGVIC